MITPNIWKNNPNVPNHHVFHVFGPLAGSGSERSSNVSDDLTKHLMDRLEEHDVTLVDQWQAFQNGRVTHARRTQVCGEPLLYLEQRS